MNTFSNDKNEFDLDSILREFGALDEEPESEIPEFEPPEPIRDEAPDEEIFSAAVETAPAKRNADGFGFDRGEIIAQFNSDGSVRRGSETINPAAIAAEFEGYGRAPSSHKPPEPVMHEPIPESEPEPPIKAAREAAAMINAAAEKAAVHGDMALDEVDRIVAEVRQELDMRSRVIEPVSEPEEPVQEFVPEPTRERIEGEPVTSEPEPDLYENSGLLDDADEDYASNEDFVPPEEPPKRAQKRSRSFRESVAVPFISALAFIAMKVKQSQVTIGSASYETEDLGEEMPPDKAARFYGKHIAGLRVRARISFILCAVLIYIAYGLPLGGALVDTGVKSAVSLILMLCVMICGLDIITTGIMSLVRFKMHAYSLIAVSCLICTIDAFLVAGGISEKTLPFCVVPSLTIAFALLGSILNVRSNRIILNTAASARNPSTLTAETPITGGDITLVKAHRTADGIVRRTEEEGPDESVFGILTPYFIAAALVLSLIAAVISKNFAGFAHILSGIFVCSAPAAMLLTFPLPFFVSTKGLIRTGSAIAGWSGLYDIGKSKHIIITDADLFPKGCVKIGKVHILSGMKPEKVISFAGSIISASGSCMVSPFSDLMRKANASLLTVEGFTVHESGGLKAMVDGEEVLCGDAAFMRLMGVVLPEKYVLRGGVYIAVSGKICGVFEMQYTATDAVKDALTELMSSGRHAIFAVRDFNVTPQMLSVKFDMPTDGFDFPPYTERYAVSGAEPSDGSRPAALISREGLGALVSLAGQGKRLYGRIRLNVMLSVMSAVIGMITAFIMSLGAGAGVTAVLTYMLAWLLISVILAFAS